MIESAAPAGLDLTNWDLGGSVSKWSYCNADRLFPTVPLVPGVRCAEDDHGREYDVPSEIAVDLASGRVSAITIMTGGRVVFRWLGRPGRHLLMSVSKVITSMAIGILAGEGRLDYDDPILDPLPELGDEWRSCRIRHVLDMTSGVDCPEVGDPGAYSDPAHPFFRFEASLGWRPTPDHRSPYDLVRTYTRSGTPGSRYEYTSVNTFLLAWIVERITGLSYARAIQRLIWDQLTLSQDAAICVNHDGVPVSHGGLIMSTDDLARFGTLFTPSQPPEQHRLHIPDGYLEMLRAPREQLTAPTHCWPAEAHPGGQWNLIHPDGDMYKSGFGGQGLYVSPANDVVIAFCGVPDGEGQNHQLAAKCRLLAARFAGHG